MANVTLANVNASLIDTIVQAIATRAAAAGATATSAAYPLFGITGYSVAGDGFTYDAGGLLTGGTIASLQYVSYVGSGSIDNPTGMTVSGLALPVPQAIALAAAPGSAAPALLAGTNTVRVNASSGTTLLYGGDDTVTLAGTGTAGYFPGTTIRVDGGGGTNVAVLPTLRDQATITAAGGSETVAIAQAYDFFGVPPVTAQLTAFSELRFIDGSVFQDDATPGAQASLVFLGILGRLPDPINVGGYALLARQSGTAAAAAYLLATPEGQADTAALDTAGYVARLYANILHRAPEAAGAAGWQAALDGGTVTRAQAAALFAASPEAQAANAATFASGSVFAAAPNAVLVQRLYETMLGRPAEASSLAPNAQALDNGTKTATILETTIAASPEFAALLRGATDDAAFAALLQRNLYGQADQATTSYYATLLGTGQATRAVVADLFAHSPGADAKVLPLATGQGVAHL